MSRYYSDCLMNDDMTEDDYIEHYGIIGMHWGIRRYQNSDGSYTDAGKKRKQKMGFFEKRKAKKNLAKARKAREDNRKREAHKREVIQKGSAKDAYEIRDQLTNEEKAYIVSRLDWDKKLGDIYTSERQNKGKSKADKFLEAYGKVGDFAKTTGTIVNTANAIRKYKNGEDVSKKKETK